MSDAHTKAILDMLRERSKEAHERVMRTGHGFELSQNLRDIVDHAESLLMDVAPCPTCGEVPFAHEAGIGGYMVTCRNYDGPGGTSAHAYVAHGMTRELAITTWNDAMEDRT